GAAVPCGKGELTLNVEVSTSGEAGPYRQMGTTEARCVEKGNGDIAVVLDLSGSESGFLPLLQQTARTFVDNGLANGRRAFLTRVSTDSRLVQELTDDAALLHAAIDRLSIGGNTALYDGIRIGNESLGGKVERTGDTRFNSASDFCDSSRKHGLVVLTDGRENS